MMDIDREINKVLDRVMIRLYKKQCEREVEKIQQSNRIGLVKMALSVQVFCAIRTSSYEERK